MDNKEHRMLKAQLLRGQGYKQHQIAEMLGVTERTVRNYLKTLPTSRKKTERTSKLDHWKPFVDSIIDKEPYYNCILLLKRIKSQGYTGKISILRDYVAEVRKKVIAEAVIRFETEPGRQAQVDWKEERRTRPDGTVEKVYAFKMVMGYSRKPFTKYVKSMKQSLLLACHVEAFIYFGGVPHEILYDNMKTAFVCDSEGIWHPNKRLLSFANHYGFVPKRCQVRRPQTKGKVERAIGYLNTNFWPQVKDSVWELDELNEKVKAWMDEICQNILRDFQETRAERFDREKEYLNPLPELDYDYRDSYEKFVSRESLITFETNKYSVNPDYIGHWVTLKVNPVYNTAEVFSGSVSLKKINLETREKHQKKYTPEDKAALIALWEKQQKRRRTRLKKAKDTKVETQNPSIYDRLTEDTGEVA